MKQQKSVGCINAHAPALATLAAITAEIILGLYLWILIFFAHSSCQNCSVILDGVSEEHSKSSQRFSIGLRSGICSKAPTFMVLSHSSGALTVCVGSLSCRG